MRRPSWLFCALSPLRHLRGSVGSMTHIFASFFAATAWTAFAQMPCEQLRSIALPGARVTLAESVAAGPFRLPGAQPAANAPTLPAHCRTAITLQPASDSDIKAEVWLPTAAAWNGKLLAAGGGGFVGSISYGPMASRSARVTRPLPPIPATKAVVPASPWAIRRKSWISPIEPSTR